MHRSFGDSEVVAAFTSWAWWQPAHKGGFPLPSLFRTPCTLARYAVNAASWHFLHGTPSRVSTRAWGPTRWAPWQSVQTGARWSPWRLFVPWMLSEYKTALFR